MMKYGGLFVFKMNKFLLMIDLQTDEETKKVTEAGEKTDEQKKEEGIIKVETTDLFCGCCFLQKNQSVFQNFGYKYSKIPMFFQN